MANRSRAVFNEAALSRYLATNSGYHDYVEGGAGNSRLDKSADEDSDATTEGDRLTSTSMKPTHCLPSTTITVHYTIIVYLEYCWYGS